LRTRWETLVLYQVVKEQLDVRSEGSVRAVRCSREEAVHLHGTVITEVQIKVVPGNSDRCDRCSGLRNRPNTSVAAKPERKSALWNN
jgi:hypothetical protein